MPPLELCITGTVPGPDTNGVAWTLWPTVAGIQNIMPAVCWACCLCSLCLRHDTAGKKKYTQHHKAELFKCHSIPPSFFSCQGRDEHKSYAYLCPKRIRIECDAIEMKVKVGENFHQQKERGYARWRGAPYPQGTRGNTSLYIQI